MTGKKAKLKTISPSPGTPTAVMDNRGKRCKIDGIDVWLKGESPSSMNCTRSPYHERAAYIVDTMLNLKLVPATVIRVVDGKVVSAQKWVYGERPSNNTPPLLAMFDYIIGNTDRHYGNWLIKKSGRVWAIDNALSFGIYVSSFFLNIALPYRIRYRMLALLKNTQRLHKRLDYLVGEEGVNALIERLRNVWQKVKDKELA